jgi:hypothetical protein
MMTTVGSRGIRRRKPYRQLPRLKSRSSGVVDEPPVMWSPGFDANPNSPAGQMQAMWRLTGRGRDTDEDDAIRERRGPMSRAGAFVLRLLGYQGRPAGERKKAA